MRANQARYPVALTCHVLGVSESGYYAWRNRPPSPRAQANALLSERITRIHASSRGTYGAPRIHAELLEEGQPVGLNRVARLMMVAGLAGVSRRKGRRTTLRVAEAQPASDLVERDFSASAPNRRWVADITYVPTWSGFLYLAVVLDAFCRRVVGWAMATHLRTELVLDALEMALGQRRPIDVIHHSDHGCQYTLIAFGSRCRKAGVHPSRGTVGNCFDNALCESFFATLECELIDGTRFPSPSRAIPEIFEFIEGFYNLRRRHSALAYLSPNEYERRYYCSKAAA